MFEMNGQDVAEFLLGCTVQTARIKGMKGSAFYTRDEIKNYLETHSPDTFGLFNAFEQAYLAWTGFFHVNQRAYENNRLSPFHKEQLLELIKNRDLARKASLEDLGLL